MLPKVDYNQRQHSVYARGRAMSAETTAMWIEVFARQAPAIRPLCVLDLGCGTGRFTPALAAEFGGPVYGVEPASRMLAEAVAAGVPPMVEYRSGSAERIPLPDASCDIVLMFLVLHHVRDRGAAAAEIVRVLRPGGRLLVRSTLSDRQRHLRWHGYFDRAADIERQLFPSSTEVVDLFVGAGLEFVSLDHVRERLAPTLAAYAERLKLRAISTFEFLTEDELDAGFARMDAAVAAEAEPRPVEADVDLMTFTAPGSTGQMP